MIQDSVLKNDAAKPAMDPAVIQYMEERSQNDLLIKPEFTGGFIANLASSKDSVNHLSGKFIEWNDPLLASFQPE